MLEERSDHRLLTHHQKRYDDDGTPRSEYRAWVAMKTRCGNSNCRSYKWYGGRGITVCERWMRYEPFFDDMGFKPNGYHLDRIDTNGNYEPFNCRWVTCKENENNRRNNVRIEFNGITRTASEWAQHIGIRVDTLFFRIKQGHPIEHCLTAGRLSDMTGQKWLGKSYFYLTPIQILPRHLCLCKCICGNEKRVRYNVSKLQGKSCGCMRKHLIGLAIRNAWERKRESA